MPEAGSTCRTDLRSRAGEAGASVREEIADSAMTTSSRRAAPPALFYRRLGAVGAEVRIMGVDGQRLRALADAAGR